MAAGSGESGLIESTVRPERKGSVQEPRQDESEGTGAEQTAVGEEPGPLCSMRR